MSRMTHPCAVVLALILAASMAPAEAAPPTNAAAPKIHADKPKHDLGKVWSHQSVDHTFEVKNTGQAPLHIKRVRSTCGCTVVKAKPITLQPGESTKVTVRFVAKGQKGKVIKSVYVESDDPAKPRLPLTLQAEVRQTITTDPAMIHFKRLDRTRPATLAVTVTNHLDEPMTLSEPTSTSPQVTVKITEIDKGKTARVELTAKPPFQADTLHGQVRFKTGLKPLPVYTMPFFGRLPPPVEIQPSPVVKLGTLQQGKPFSKSATLRSTDGKPFKITRVTSDNWRIMPSIREVTPGLEYEILVIARPPFEWGVNNAQIGIDAHTATTHSLRLQVIGELPQPIVAGPSTLLFKDLQVDKGGEARVTIAIKDDASPRFTSVYSTNPKVKAKLEPVTPGKEWKLVATATPPLEPGRLEGEVILMSTHPEMDMMAVPIQSFPITEPLPPVSVLPKSVLIIPQAGASDKPTNTRLIVRANNNEKARVTKVEVSNPAITARIEPRTGAEATMTYIQLAIPSDAKLDPNGETITIHTDHPAARKLTHKIARYGTPGSRVRTRSARVAAPLPLKPKKPAK